MILFFFNFRNHHLSFQAFLKKKKHVWETLINKNRGENTYYTNITFLLFLHDNVTMVVPLPLQEINDLILWLMLIFLYEISSCNFINVSTREMRVLIFLPVK